MQNTKENKLENQNCTVYGPPEEVYKSKWAIYMHFDEERNYLCEPW